MGMNLGIKKATFNSSEDQTWLGSASGTQSMDSITLDQALCVAKFPTGLVPSGIPLKRQASGRYAPALDNGAAADDIPEYHLFTTVDLTGGAAIGVTAAFSDTPASGFWSGEIIVAKVPTYAGITLLTANTTVNLIKYI